MKTNHFKSLLSCLLFLSFLFLTNIPAFTAENSSKTYANNQYAVSYPEDWRIEKSEMGTTLKGMGGISINIAETPPTELTPKQFAEDSLKEQTRIGQKFNTTKKEDYKTKKSGYPAFMMGFMDGQDESQLHFVKLPDNRIIVFSVGKDEKLSPEDIKLSQQIVNSVVFTP